MPQRKGDWAVKKAAKGWWGNAYIPTKDYSDDEDINAIAKLLRAERARAVRVCRKASKGISNSFINNDEILAYRIACDDCANAIGGKKA